MTTIELHLTENAQLWAKEFMRLHKGKLKCIDEALMIVWFANAITAGYDTAMSRQPDLTSIRAVYEKYKHLDNGLSDTHLVVGEFGGHIRYELWQAVKGICKEGTK